MRKSNIQSKEKIILENQLLNNQLIDATRTVETQNRLISKFSIYLGIISLIATFLIVIFGYDSFKKTRELNDIITSYNQKVKETYAIVKWEAFEQSFKRGLDEYSADHRYGRSIYVLFKSTPESEIEAIEDKIILLMKGDDRFLEPEIISFITSVLTNERVYNRTILSFLFSRYNKVCRDEQKIKSMLMQSIKIDRKIGLTDDAKRTIKKAKERCKKQSDYLDTYERRLENATNNILWWPVTQIYSIGAESIIFRDEMIMILKNSGKLDSKVNLA